MPCTHKAAILALTYYRMDRQNPERNTAIMPTLPDDLFEAALDELEHSPAFKTLCQSEAIYVDGIRHALGDEYLSTLVKLKEIYDTRTRAVARAAFRLGFEWGMKQDLMWRAHDNQ